MFPLGGHPSRAVPAGAPARVAALVGHLACWLGLGALVCSLFALVAFTEVVVPTSLQLLLAAHAAQFASMGCLVVLWLLSGIAAWLGAERLSRRAWLMSVLSLATLVLTPWTTVCYGP